MLKNCNTYEISVSLNDECYRHIKISADSTLEQLSSAILEAFSFGEDHMHAFFMTNRVWDDYGDYFAKGIGMDVCLTCDYNLSEVGLFRNKEFLCIFDIGEEWQFQCVVLRVLKKSISEPVLAASKGTPPKQPPRQN
ncbi:MAG: IS1096 element passenger TnpR family protein [Candidatus Saccharimonadales bacterium]